MVHAGPALQLQITRDDHDPKTVFLDPMLGMMSILQVQVAAFRTMTLQVQSRTPSFSYEDVTSLSTRTPRGSVTFQITHNIGGADEVDGDSLTIRILLRQYASVVIEELTTLTIPLPTKLDPSTISAYPCRARRDALFWISPRGLEVQRARFERAKEEPSSTEPSEETRNS